MGQLPVRAAPVRGDEGKSGDDEQEERGVVGLGVREILHLVVDGDGEGAGSTGDVSADHENHAEFADGMGEDECNRGEHRSFGERQEELAKDADASGAEQSGLFAEGRIDGLKAGDEGLHGKRKAIDDRADDESPEGEGERMANDVCEEPAGGGLRAKQNEEIETENGGRQQERQGADGFDDGAQAGAGENDPGGDEGSEDEQDERGDRCEAHGEPERGEVDPMLRHYSGGSAVGDSRPAAASKARILGCARNSRKRCAAAAFLAPLTTTAPWMRGA